MMSRNAQLNLVFLLAIVACVCLMVALQVNPPSKWCTCKTPQPVSGPFSTHYENDADIALQQVKDRPHPTIMYAAPIGPIQEIRGRHLPYSEV